MATRSKTNASGTSSDADETVAGLQAAAGALPDLGRRQLVAVAEGMSAFFRASEAVQQVHLQMAQRVALLHGQAAENLRKATSPIELATVQGTLAVYQWQETMRYWQELSAAVTKASTQVMRPEAAQEGMRAAANEAPSMMEAAMNAAAPMAEAFQQMFTAPLKSAQQSAH